MFFIFEKTSQKLGICTHVCGIPNFSLLFSLGAKEIFRALLSATAVSSAAPEKLLKKFYQNFWGKLNYNLSVEKHKKQKEIRYDKRRALCKKE